MDLVKKYNIPVPRYTSYPTVPYWENNVTEAIWKESVKDSFIKNNKDGISLYIHLPFCESLCTYCACNTRITVNHKVETPYVDALLNEWKLYLHVFGSTPIIREIHLGGGTPTFFSAQNLKRLITEILITSGIHPEHEFSFEGHPSNTTFEHLKALFDLGFRRVSFGIQDFDEKVQDTINRYQSFDEVKKVMQYSREIGYTSINVDLVYGLPYQTSTTIKDTIQKIISLRPERIAFYSYAHVPWLKPGQRKYSEKDLPADSVKRALYESGKELFSAAGYKDVGMDHFALPDDSLFDAFKKNKLHRNFMGYTTSPTKLLIGLGVSAISDTWNAFAQNIKTVEEYQACITANKFPVTKGHVLTPVDVTIRQHILDLMCKHFTFVTDDAIFERIEPRLHELKKDDLVLVKGNEVQVTEKGKPFLRNICLAFDDRYWEKVPEGELFSTSA